MTATCRFLAASLLAGLASFSTAAFAACVSYLPEFPGILRVRSTGGADIRVTSPSGQQVDRFSSPYSFDAEFNDIRDAVVGAFGGIDGPRAFQKCDGVFPAFSAQFSPANTQFTVTVLVDTHDGKINITETGIGKLVPMDGNCGPVCNSDNVQYVKTHAYDIVSGRLDLHVRTDRVFKATLANGNVLDSVAFDEGRATYTLTAANVPPPVFPMTVTSSITAERASATAVFEPRPQDAGQNTRIFVFAVAPATVAKDAQLTKDAHFGWMATPTSKADPVPCVLAQLNANGQLQAVSASNLQAAITGVLTAQGQAVTILDNVATPNVAGATFYVGYGQSADAMLDSGVNRSAVTVPGSVVCQPAPPQTGWWWNPAEDGRGFSIEVRGSNIFVASFLYDVSGRSNWYVSTGPVSLDGSLYRGELLSASGGQALGGAYPGRPAIKAEGPFTLALNSSTQGTIVWPGGVVPVQRLPFVPNGLTGTNPPTTPENGWWWNEAESGRGFFLEWQNGSLDIAGYMYDEAGNPVWYLTVGTMTAPGGNRFEGSWWSFGNGQTLTGAWRPNTRLSTTVAPLTITFSGPDTALLTLPNGRNTTIKRHRF
jgi:hypothetical protein